MLQSTNIQYRQVDNIQPNFNKQGPALENYDVFDSSLMLHQLLLFIEMVHLHTRLLSPAARSDIKQDNQV